MTTDADLQEYSDVEYVFRPHDRSIPAARRYLEDVWDRRPFMAAHARAEMRGGRHGTLLGEMWGVLDPLFQALIYWFLFTAIRGREGTGSDLFLMVVSGVFLFNFGMTLLGQGGRSIQRSKGLVLNSAFPLATIPLSTLYRALLEFIPTVAIYGLFHILWGRPIGASLMVLPLLFVLQVMISVGLMLFFATLTVYIRDMSNLLDYILRILLFITPVIYPVAKLDAVPGIMHTILYLNPLFALFSAYQAALAGQMPDPGLVFQATLWAIVLPVTGFRFFVSRERGFALRL